MNKRIVMTTLILLSFLSINLLSAAGEKNPGVQAVLAEIRQNEGLKQNENINPQKVSPAKLEELGDSVMEAMIGNHDLHEEIDKRWGGEGSDALKEMHRRIGYNYLTGYPLGMMGWMMGYPYNNNGTNQIFGPNRFKGGYPMMWGNGWNGGWPGMMGWGFGGVFAGLIFLILVILAVVFVIRAARGGAYRGFGETPLEILKKRYAKGEITKDEFEKIKKDITG